VQVLLNYLALPKAGNSASDYEDAAFPLEAPTTPVTRFRVAIADGATESSFAALWARLLVEAFVHKRLLVRGQRVLAQLASLQQTWQQAVASKPLPWYAEEKLRAGAFCAFLGLELAEGRRGATWQAWAVGDSCLVQVREDAVLAAFPLTNADAFNSRPFLIGCQARHHAEAVGAIRRAHGAWQPGDRFFLLTDALAAWFLADHAAGNHPAATLEGLLAARDSGAPAAWLADQRSAHQVRNDDTTLLRITLQDRPQDA